ncbi:MAG: ligase-associated DNA damage response exonuclease [Acidobacteria bacterium]|nr:ligase-associated DNA damage response exonuclease [Acidobacteriota bacterium]
MINPLVIQSESGLYCEAGDFYIDPWQPVERAVVTHPHSDHAHPGCRHYLASQEGERIYRIRLGIDANIETIPYENQININGVSVSLYPAGHIIGSSQIRLEYRGEVWVVSGDYKLRPDPTCSPFEPIPCHTFITEATFGLPIYRWPSPESVLNEINDWWRNNQQAHRASLLLAYSVGKAQRILKGIDATIGPIYTHGAVEKMVNEYRASGVDLPATTLVYQSPKKTDWSKALIIAPPSAQGTPWMRRFGALSTAFASGWMSIRGTRRRQALDRGFVISDHADWEELLAAIWATGAEQVWVTHGYVPVLARYLREEHGLDARELKTSYQGEGEGETGENNDTNEKG